VQVRFLACQEGIEFDIEAFRYRVQGSDRNIGEPFSYDSSSFSVRPHSAANVADEMPHASRRPRMRSPIALISSVMWFPWISAVYINML
jgi:hypothetical protein